MEGERRGISRVVQIAVLIIAGEMVFALPFHTARFFRPTMLDVFGLTNTELGDLFAAYGVIAMLSYFPGGALADRFPARWLLTASLFATATGGVVMATTPDALTLALLYAFWGFTTIFLFWGALIRATREWGGYDTQGLAFGLLEGGRGLAAAGVAALLVLVFAAALPADPALATAAVRQDALSQVILLYAVVTALAGLLVWWLIPVPADPGTVLARPVTGMRVVLGRPVIWAQAGVIACAYCGFKGLDNYALYAVDVLGMNEVDAARFATWSAYLRPVAAILAGVAADRWSAMRVCALLFLVLTAAFLALGGFAPGRDGQLLIVLTVLLSFAGVFALRGVYFALLEENRTPVRYTGAAVGMVSLVGFTPEIFFAPIAGRILDANPGLVGHQHYFLFLAAIAAAGMLFTFVLLRLHRPGGQALWPAAPANGHNVQGTRSRAASVSRID
jgi:nitrate/nitrite transporter NarK